MNIIEDKAGPRRLTKSSRANGTGDAATVRILHVACTVFMKRLVEQGRKLRSRMMYSASTSTSTGTSTGTHQVQAQMQTSARHKTAHREQQISRYSMASTSNMTPM